MGMQWLLCVSLHLSLPASLSVSVSVSVVCVCVCLLVGMCVHVCVKLRGRVRCVRYRFVALQRRVGRAEKKRDDGVVLPRLRDLDISRLSSMTSTTSDPRISDRVHFVPISPAMSAVSSSIPIPLARIPSIKASSSPTLTMPESTAELASPTTRGGSCPRKTSPRPPAGCFAPTASSTRLSSPSLWASSVSSSTRSTDFRKVLRGSASPSAGASSSSQTCQSLKSIPSLSAPKIHKLQSRRPPLTLGLAVPEQHKFRIPHVFKLHECIKY